MKGIQVTVGNPELLDVDKLTANLGMTHGELGVKIVFAGNCQAYALYYLFERHLAGSLDYQVGWVDAWNEHRLSDCAAQLATADLVVQQVFTGMTRVPIDELSGRTQRIKFPDVRGSFLWPFGNVPRINNPSRPFKGGGPYDTEVGDSFLNRLVETNVEANDALARYLDLDVARSAHLDRVFELTLDQQRSRDALADLSIADFIEKRFRHERLFNTQGHLSVELFLHLSTQVFARLGADDHLLADFSQHITVAPFERYHDSPVHPQVIEHFKLSYLDEEPTYHHVQEGRFTFAERVIRYMNNEWSPDLHEGCAYADRGDAILALPLLESGLRDAPRSAFGHARKSQVLRDLSRFEDAVDSSRRAAELEPNDPFFAHLHQEARECLSR